MRPNVTKQEWVDMFVEAGLSEAQMKHWHQIFETRHPEAHEEFLAWLGIDGKEIAAIRAASR